ncbi:MAG: HAD-IIA family hydrolase [Aigarchaeota archaeon]|nr:HAD-IIA family hydrolase [Aigarchaeota archaeon]MDW8021134.1 HAD-IIA family hydrolase [Nitrososphaerota archaeon]
MLEMKRYRGVIMDLDGCVYVGDKPTAGAVDALKRLNDLGIKILYVTNNPGKTSESSAEMLRKMGVDCDPGNVLTVGEATALYIYSRSGPSRVLIFAGEGVEVYCRKIGHKILSLNEWDQADYLIVGHDRGINYEKLKAGLRAILKGAVFIGTNPDPTHPGPDGLEPGSGAIIAPFKAMTNVDPIIIGKPSRIVMDIALEKLGMGSSEVLVVGDRVDTDVQSGRVIGADTALILTGVTKEEDLDKIPSALRPTYVFKNLRELVDELFASPI